MNKYLLAAVLSIPMSISLASAAGYVDVTFDSGERIYEDSIDVVEGVKSSFSEETSKTYQTKHRPYINKGADGVFRVKATSISKNVTNGFSFWITPNKDVPYLYRVEFIYRGKPVITSKEFNGAYFTNIEGQMIRSTEFYVRLPSGKLVCIDYGDGIEVRQKLCLTAS